ncbi:IS1380 family transposase [Microbacterium sp.]|uniref:IS1380 family transposase n=1 Tax=Microbacterium sp. TaxID=51671 RepID=UPI003C70FDCF
MKSTGVYPRVHVDAADVAAIGHAGGVLLTETIRATGLDRALSGALGRWRKPFAVHDPGKIVGDLAIALALGGDAMSDLATVRAEPGIYGRVASDPTVSRLVTALAEDADNAVAAISAARAAARAVAWERAGQHAPDAAVTPDRPVVIDLDATLITAHSEKEQAAATFKRGFGFHPLCAFADHGPEGTGEMLAIRLRPGNAGSNTAADHIAVVKAALAQLPGSNPRPGKGVLIRTDGAGGTKEFVSWMTGRRLSYSVGFTLPFHTPDLYRLISEDCWSPALDAEGDPREGADVAELTGLLDLHGWPADMRVILRRERPHPGAQLRFDDVDGYRLTAFATNTRRGQHATLELRHRRRARCEDRIRHAKDTGLRNLPLHGFDQNRIWCELVALATDLIAWTGLLAHPDHEARRWEPKRLRHRLFTIPATLARTGRRIILHLSSRSRWSSIVLTGINTLRALPARGG